MEGNNKKLVLSIILSLVCIIVEIVSMICTLAFSRTYDETESNLPVVSFILMGTSLFGQIFGCCIAAKLSKGTSEAMKLLDVSVSL